MKVLEIDYYKLPICHYCRKKYADKKYESSHKLYKPNEVKDCDEDTGVLEMEVKVPCCKKCSRLHLEGLYSVGIPTFLISFFFFYRLVFFNNNMIAFFTENHILLTNILISVLLSGLIAFVSFRIANKLIVNQLYKNNLPKSSFYLYHTVRKLLDDGWSLKKLEAEMTIKNQIPKNKEFLLA